MQLLILAMLSITLASQQPEWECREGFCGRFDESKTASLNFYCTEGGLKGMVAFKEALPAGELSYQVFISLDGKTWKKKQWTRMNGRKNVLLIGMADLPGIINASNLYIQEGSQETSVHFVITGFKGMDCT